MASFVNFQVEESKTTNNVGRKKRYAAILSSSGGRFCAVVIENDTIDVSWAVGGSLGSVPWTGNGAIPQHGL